MIIVPTDAPGVNILRDVPTMGEPDHKTGEPGGHAEILYENVRVPIENMIGNEGDGFLLAQKRLGPGPHPSRDALARSVAARVRHAVRALAVAVHARLAARREADDPGLDRRVVCRDAGGAAAHAAGRVEDGPGRRVEGPRRDRDHQVLGREGALQRDRPCDPGARRRSATRPICRSSRCTARRARRASTTGPTRCTRSTVARQTLKRYKAADVPTEHVPTRRRAALEKFADQLDAIAISTSS